MRFLRKKISIFADCLKKNSGFSFVELIVAMFIFLVGIVGSYIVINYQITDIRSTNSRLTALYLGQEAIEIVKNVRDENLIEKNSWDNGLADGCYQVAYNNVSLNFKSALNVSPCGNCQSTGYNYLNLDSNGFYSYSSGTQTKFKREIKIESSTNGGYSYKKVSVTVCWKDGGNNYSAIVVDNLYGYWNP